MENPDPEDDKKIIPLDEDDIALLKTYGLGPYSDPIKGLEVDLRDISKKVNDLCGIKESDTGLAQPSSWDLTQDKQAMQEEQPLQVARCTKIINPGTDDAQYVINVKQIAKFVVGLGQHVAPTDIEEGMRVGVDRTKYFIHIPLPAKIDPTVTMMTVEESRCIQRRRAEQGAGGEAALRWSLCCIRRSSCSSGSILPRSACYGLPGTGHLLARRGEPHPRVRDPRYRVGAVQKRRARARDWCVSCSRWRGARRRASSFSMRWTPRRRALRRWAGRR